MTHTRQPSGTRPQHSVQPHHIFDALPNDDRLAVKAFHQLLPHVLRHPIFFRMIDSDSPTAGILLRLYYMIFYETTTDTEEFSNLVFGLQASLVLDSDPVALQSILELILEWSKATRIRHRGFLIRLVTDIMESIPELERDVLKNHVTIQKIYKKMYKSMVRLQKNSGVEDRAIMLARLYKDHEFSPGIGEMIAGCLRSDNWLRSNSHARCTFFVDIAYGMDAIHPKLTRFMVRGDKIAVYRRIQKMVLDLLGRKPRTQLQTTLLFNLKPVLQWTFHSLPANERPVLDRTADTIIRRRNRDFQTRMRSTVGEIRGRIRSRVGVPTNLPVFSQLRNLTRKSIMRDDNAERRILAMIDDLQAQIQRNRFG